MISLLKNKVNYFSIKMPEILIYLFFLIPAFSILGNFFPDLFIVITVLYVFFTNFKNKESFFYNYIKNDNFIKFFLIFLSYLLLNSIINFFYNNFFSFNLFKDYFSRTLFLFRFIIYPISIIYLAKKFNLRFKKKYGIILLFTILFVLTDTLIQYYFGKDLFGFEPKERGQLALNRLSGPFNDELIPGGFLMRYLFVSLFLLVIIVKKKFFNMFFIFFITFNLCVILLTGERAAFALSSFGLLICFIIFKNFRTKLLISFFFGLFFLSLILLNNSNLKNRVIDYTYFQLGLDEKNSSFIDSPYGAHYETALKIWNNNKLIGIGVKQFRVHCAYEEYNDIKSKLRSVRCATHPHNTYLEILSETGLIGMGFFLLLFFFLIKKIYFIHKYEKNIKWILISIILLFWPIISTGSFFTNGTQIYFSFLLTIIFLLERKKNFFSLRGK
jgi:O-antigen ligase